MKPFRIAEKARDDLASIWNYIAVENDAPEAADKIMDGLESVFRQLGKHPLIGPSRPEFGSQLRSFPQGNYIVFYRPTPESVEIVRVLHGARDLETLFKE
jgi:toxin ParE1/3/4